MARRAVFMSDVHGNLPALETVYRSLPQSDAVFVAGDLCLEGPCPDATLDRLVEWGWTLVMGNTDRDVTSPDPSAKPSKRNQVAWTREKLGPQRLARLEALPFSASFGGDGADDVLVVHANPKNMNEHLSPTLSPAEVLAYLSGVACDILVFGHLHTPYVRPVDGTLLVDVSSVGHPKDRDRRAAYTIITWDRGGRSVDQVRVPYNVEATVELLRKSDMPGAGEQIESLLKASY